MDQTVLTRLDPAKFRDPLHTARGEQRAQVNLRALETLWFNTGTLCNITCQHCYIESSPRNARLSYLTRAEAAAYLDEIARDGLPTRTIGFTGGEPFMSPHIIGMMDDALARGFEVLVLTNAMKPMQHRRASLLALQSQYRKRLTIRVSLDHYTAAVHEAERGPGTWAPALQGLIWLARNGFSLHVAGRHFTPETDSSLRAGYASLFADLDLPVDASDPVQLMLFPEMDSQRDVPEITTSCWSILGKSPDDVMCATARMVVKRKDSEHPAVLACTLIPYDPQFELGRTLRDAAAPVPLNHPYCASFCVLGGAACSR